MGSEMCIRDRHKYSYNGATLWVLDIETAVENIRNAAQKLFSEHPEVIKVVLFGSLADGTAVPSSDADILLILKNSPKSRWIDRIDDYIDYFIGIGIGVDLFPYTKDEVEKILLAKTALNDGTVLTER